jgi:hypothetical protein
VAYTEVIAEFQDHILDTDGMHYVARVCGGARTDGTWSGWLEFVAVGRQQLRRTETETTQPDREALVHWAGSLGPAFLEGAFARAR